MALFFRKEGEALKAARATAAAVQHLNKRPSKLHELLLPLCNTSIRGTPIFYQVNCSLQCLAWVYCQPSFFN